MRKGKIAYACAKKAGRSGRSHQKTSALEPTNTAASAVSSIPRRLRSTDGASGPVSLGDRKTSRIGAKTRSPTRSPTHHARHVSPSAACSTTPPRRRLATPRVALTQVLATAARLMSARTSRTRSSEGRKRATRRSAQAPSTASAVLPTAMPTATATGAPVHRFAANAPRATPGQTPYPRRRTAASAIPVAGQTSVAKPPTASSARPILATSA